MLAVAGRHGPLLLCVAMLLGFAAPALAEAARPLIGLGVFVFTFGAFLKVPVATLGVHAGSLRTALAVLLWSTIAVPLLTFAFIRLVPLPATLEQATLLFALAPASSSAVAVAAMLGLNPGLALLVSLAATLLSPLYLPPLAAALVDPALRIDPAALSMRLAVITVGAAALAWLFRRAAPSCVGARPAAITGVSVLGLLLVTLGAMAGVRADVLAAPGEVAASFASALLTILALQALGAIAFAFLGRQRSLTIGLITGNRSIALVLAAGAPFFAARPDIERYLALCVIATFLLPAVSSWVLALANRPRNAAPAGRALSSRPGWRSPVSHAGTLALGIALGTLSSVLVMYPQSRPGPAELAAIDRLGGHAVLQRSLGPSPAYEHALSEYARALELHREALGRLWGEGVFASEAVLTYARLAVLAEQRGDALTALARYAGAAHFCDEAAPIECLPDLLRTLAATAAAPAGSRQAE
jgi:predicted Na+-dependent transporter